MCQLTKQKTPETISSITPGTPDDSLCLSELDVWMSDQLILVYKDYYRQQPGYVRFWNGGYGQWFCSGQKKMCYYILVSSVKRFCVQAGRVSVCVCVCVCVCVVVVVVVEGSESPLTPLLCSFVKDEMCALRLVGFWNFLQQNMCAI